MVDFAIIDGDKALFMPLFGAAVVVVQPGTITGSGFMTFGSKAVCVDGDESSVSVPGCTYIASPYVVPGVGTLKIESLASDQLATKTQTDGKAIMLKGGNFTAVFEVQTPAQMPPSASTPDPNPKYSGSGSFLTSNTKLRGT